MDVNFNEDQGLATRQQGPKTPTMVRLAMKMGAQSEEQANYILIGVAVAFIILAIIIYKVFV